MPLEVSDVHAGYEPGIDILRGVDLIARDRQLTTVIGANGVGKSTLLKVIIGRLRPHRGQITFDGRDLTRVATRELAGTGIAYIAQRHMIFGEMSVAENLELGAWSFRRDRARVRRALEQVYERAPFLREFRRRPASLLSGGQQRLLEIERALMTEPRLLLIDEPTVGLDPARAELVYRRLRELVGEEGRTVLMVDQNILAGVRVADHVYVLELGTNRMDADRETFERKYLASIADWLL